MTQRRVKLQARSLVKLRARAGPEVKPDPGAEDWKILRSFVGVKFNDAEKQRLWKAVAGDFVDPEGYRKARRPNLGTFIKKAIWEKIARQK